MSINIRSIRATIKYYIQFFVFFFFVSIPLNNEFLCDSIFQIDFHRKRPKKSIAQLTSPWRFSTCHFSFIYHHDGTHITRFFLYKFPSHFDNGFDWHDNRLFFVNNVTITKSWTLLHFSMFLERKGVFWCLVH